MVKKNGFVFMETIIVIAILSITLVLLFSSYSYILRKSRQRNTFDTTETIYKTYFVKKAMDNYKIAAGGTGNSVEYYMQHNLSSGECRKLTYGSDISFTCDLSSPSYSGYLAQLKRAFEIDKIYYLNPNKVTNSASSTEWLNKFDATTIDYIREIGPGSNYYILIVKFKKTYNSLDGTYEVFHASMEVN